MFRTNMVLEYTKGSITWNLTLMVTPNNSYPIVVAVAAEYESNPIDRPADKGGLTYWVNGYMANCKAANPSCKLTDSLVPSVWDEIANAINYSWTQGEKPMGTPPIVHTHCDAKAKGL